MAHVHVVFALILILSTCVTTTRSRNDGNMSVYGQGKETTASKYLTKLDPCIVGGRSIESYEFPWVVSLMYFGMTRWDEKWHGHLCGGIIIRDNESPRGRLGPYQTKRILTAAHCFDDVSKNVSQWQVLSACKFSINRKHEEVRCNSHIRYGYWKIHAVLAFSIHEHYEQGTQRNDIAVVHLYDPIVFNPYARPILLPPIDEETLPADDEIAHIAGWGFLKEHGPPSEDLQRATVKVVGHFQCAQSYSNTSITIFPKEMLCSGAPGKGTCKGDSGGPLVIERKRGYTVEGITSFGHGCARPEYPGVYTRVRHYLPWLKARGLLDETGWSEVRRPSPPK